MLHNSKQTATKQMVIDAIINGTLIYIDGNRVKGEDATKLSDTSFNIIDWGIHEWHLSANLS